MARPADYREALDELIRSRFKTRRAFSEATGLSEDMLSHVLARREHLSTRSNPRCIRRYALVIVDEFGFDKIERSETPQAVNLLYKIIGAHTKLS